MLDANKHVANPERAQVDHLAAQVCIPTSKKRIIGNGHNEASTEHHDGSKTTRLGVKITPTRLQNTKIMRLLISQQGQKSKGFKRKCARLTLNNKMILRKILDGYA